jgi:HEPN domain-containing protein
MMSKADHISYWVDTADKNWRALHNMVQAGDNVEALFWAHLVIEKLSKALWVKDNEENMPPRSHNLDYLLARTSFSPTPEQTSVLAELNRFQLEGRYPDYVQTIYKITTNDFTRAFLVEITHLRQCLLDKLQ